MTSFIPSFSQLSSAQDDVLDVPLGQSLIVTGTPGSGKTIMAIYRAKMLHDAGEPTQLLTYNNLLASYVRDAVEHLGIDGVVSTYHQWFHNFFRTCYGRAAPKSDQWGYDWQACKEIILRSPLPERDRRHFIVDEGQDMPQDFYLVLSLVSQSMTIFADENQRITEDQSTIDEIKAASNISEVRELTVNHRNTSEIAKLAFHYRARREVGSSPDLSKLESGSPPRLERTKDQDEALKDIVDLERSNPDKRIGVLLPQVKLLKSFYTRLSGKTAKPVQVYLNRSARGKLEIPKLARPGVTLISWASAKGLDFDVVVLPELQAARVDPRSELFRMQMYVLISRAKEQIIFMYSGEGEPELVTSLPIDEFEVLRGTIE